MIQNDEQLREAQFDVQKLWRILEEARQAHAARDYEILATPHLQRLRERQQEILEYLSTTSDETAFA